MRETVLKESGDRRVSVVPARSDKGAPAYAWVIEHKVTWKGRCGRGTWTTWEHEDSAGVYDSPVKAIDAALAVFGDG